MHYLERPQRCYGVHYLEACTVHYVRRQVYKYDTAALIISAASMHVCRIDLDLNNNTAALDIPCVDLLSQDRHYHTTDVTNESVWLKTDSGTIHMLPANSLPIAEEHCFWHKKK